MRVEDIYPLLIAFISKKRYNLEEE